MRQAGSPTQLELKDYMQKVTFKKIRDIAEHFGKSSGTIKKRLKIAVDDYEVPYLETREGIILLRNGIGLEISLWQYIVLLQAVRRQKGIFLHYYHSIKATNSNVRQIGTNFDLEEPQQIDTNQTLKFLGDTTSCIEKSARHSELILIKKSVTNLD